MTLRPAAGSYLPGMKTSPLLLSTACLAALQLSSPAAGAQQAPSAAPAGTPAPASAAASTPSSAAADAVSNRQDSAKLLREALFEEQAMRDPVKAAAGYEQIIAAYDTERALAATALYRLAEVRRAQSRNDLAAALYRRVLTEFPDHDPLARLSRENLAALGVKDLPADTTPAGAKPSQAPDPEDARIAELKGQVKNSPDTLRDPMKHAIDEGQVKVVNFLLQSGVTAQEDFLETAAAQGHLSICAALIEHGANVNKSGALKQAVANGFTEVVRLLLSKGADPNRAQSIGFNNAGISGAEASPLFIALSYDMTEIAELLLKAKASPNLPPPAKSPLYATVKAGDLKAVKRLLEAGADPKVRCLDISQPSAPSVLGANSIAVKIRPQPSYPPEVVARNYQATTDPGGWSILHAAVGSGNPDMLSLLLERLAKEDLKKELEATSGPDQMSPLACALAWEALPMVELLLKAGANPNDADRDGIPLLFWAASANKAAEPMMKALLAAGADAAKLSPDGNNVLSTCRSNAQEKTNLIRLLVEAGADPTAGARPLLPELTGSVAVPLARRFHYPKWARENGITLSLPESVSKHWELPRPVDSVTVGPPSLAELMLDCIDSGKLTWLKESRQSDGRRGRYEPDWGTLRIFRRDTEGQLKEEVYEEWLTTPPPALRWGDVVEFLSPDWDKETAGQRAENLEYTGKLPEGFTAKLQASVAHQVSVTLNGQTWPITLQGSLKVYNPLKPEAPLTDAVSLMNLMGGGELRWHHASVRVKRQASQGGGEITAALRGGAVIPLKEGDSLELVGEPSTVRSQQGIAAIVDPVNPRTGSASRVSDIVLISPGLPFSQTFPVPKNSALPTLTEFLAASWPVAPPGVMQNMASAQKVASLTALTGAGAVEAWGNDLPQSLLPHPDWTRLKIRRVNEKSEVTEIPVNLAEAIAACTEATTPEEARKSDIELKPGDVILLPVLENRQDQPWQGWDERTTRFFSKALAMQVTLADADGSFRALNLEYLPVRYLESSVGLLGLPAIEPAPNRLTRFVASELVTQAAPGRAVEWLQRAGASGRSAGAFDQAALRPGDTIGMTHQPKPGQPVIQSPPPRAVPAP